MGELAPRPNAGRTFTATRLTRLGDAGPDGRLRLDALARWLQDVASDDARDAGVEGLTWVVRRTALLIDRRPRLGEMVELTTWAGGAGSRWAERRTSVTVAGRGIEAAALWVLVDLPSGRPRKVPPEFHEVYGEATGGRQVSSRLTLPAEPEPAGVQLRRWPLRHTDYDVLGHVNNAAYWSAVEDEVVRAGLGLASVTMAELEYRTAIEPGDDIELTSQATEGGLLLWLRSRRGLHGVARLT